MAADEVIGERAGAFVGDDRHVDSGRRLEQLGREIIFRARRWRAAVEFVRLGVGDHLGHRLGRKRRMRHQNDRRFGNEADRHEVLERRVARIGVEAWIDRDRAGVREHEGVAVRLRLGDLASADRAAASGPVLDHDALLERNR